MISTYILVPKVAFTYKSHSPATSICYLETDDKTASAEVEISTTRSVQTFNLGELTSLPKVKNLPATVSTDGDGIAKFTYQASTKAKGVVLTLDKQTSTAQDMLPADYLNQFSITELR